MIETNKPTSLMNIDNEIIKNEESQINKSETKWHKMKILILSKILLIKVLYYKSKCWQKNRKNNEWMVSIYQI